MLSQAVQREEVKSRSEVGSDVSVTEMMSVVARAYLAENTQGGSAWLRKLNYVQLTNEYHWALVVLDRRNLLSDQERFKAAAYAHDFFEFPLSIVR